jgi:uncharacterized OsmC-like protein
MGVGMKVDYKGQLHTELLHEPSSSRIETDAPVDNEGRGAAFSPTDLVGAALASCALTTMAIKSKKEGIPFESAAGRVVKSMTASGPRRIEQLELDFELPGSLSAPQRERLEEIARTCPVSLSLSPSVKVEMRFKYR